jgi:hypothetical protein
MVSRSNKLTSKINHDILTVIICIVKTKQVCFTEPRNVNNKLQNNYSANNVSRRCALVGDMQ